MPVDPNEPSQPSEDARSADAPIDQGPPGEGAVTGEAHRTNGTPDDHGLEADYDDGHEVERTPFDDDDRYWANS